MSKNMLNAFGFQLNVLCPPPKNINEYRFKMTEPITYKESII